MSLTYHHCRHFRICTNRIIEHWGINLFCAFVNSNSSRGRGFLRILGHFSRVAYATQAKPQRCYLLGKDYATRQPCRSTSTYEKMRVIGGARQKSWISPVDGLLGVVHPALPQRLGRVSMPCAFYLLRPSSIAWKARSTIDAEKILPHRALAAAMGLHTPCPVLEREYSASTLRPSSQYPITYEIPSPLPALCGPQVSCIMYHVSCIMYHVSCKQQSILASNSCQL